MYRAGRRRRACMHRAIRSALLTRSGAIAQGINDARPGPRASSCRCHSKGNVASRRYPRDRTTSPCQLGRVSEPDRLIALVGDSVFGPGLLFALMAQRSRDRRNSDLAVAGVEFVGWALGVLALLRRLR